MNFSLLNSLNISLTDLHGQLLSIPVMIIGSLVVLFGSNWGTSVSITNYPKFEVMWLILPIIMLFMVSRNSILMGEANVDHRSTEIIMFLVASQWNWSGSIVTSMDVIFTLMQYKYSYTSVSEDVLHSFSIRDCGVHLDCVPGKELGCNVIWDVMNFMFVTCQELCGYGHSGMTFLMEISIQ